MGLGDLFSKQGREIRARERNIKGALNKYAQSIDRMKHLEALRDDGHEDALLGLCKRFGVVYDKSIEDEQEKEWVFDVLVAKGPAVMGALKKYLFAADSISWPLRVLSKIAANRSEELDVVKLVLDRHEPGYERDPSKKMQLLSRLGSLKEPRAAALIAPYLADMDEGVRFTAVEALLRQKNEEAAREPLLDLFVSDKEESLRIRIRIAEGFADLGWLVHGHRGTVEKKLPDGFQIDREGHVKRKPGSQKDGA